MPKPRFFPIFLAFRQLAPIFIVGRLHIILATNSTTTKSSHFYLFRLVWFVHSANLSCSVLAVCVCTNDAEKTNNYFQLETYKHTHEKNLPENNRAPARWSKSQIVEEKKCKRMRE